MLDKAEKTDKIIVCKRCGKEFVFTAGEQEFYEEKDFTAPVRCKECREEKKAYMEQMKENAE